MRQTRGAADAWRRWGTSLGLALGLHAAIVGGVLWWQARRAPEPLPVPAEAVMVELAPLPEAPPSPPAQLPPGPPRREQRKAAPPPVPVPPPPRKAPQADIAVPDQAQAQQGQERAVADIDQASAPPSVQAPTGQRHAASQTLAGVAPQAMVTWQAQVLGHLERFKRYPRAAQRRRQEGVVQVQYAVDRQGQVLRVALLRSSGRDTLDAEAVAAVQRASPLPAPPPEIDGEVVEVTTPVEFFLR